MIRTLRVLRHSAICARPLMPSGARPLSNSFVPSTAAKMGRAGVRTVFPVANRLAAGGLALGTACFASSTTLAEAEQTSVRLALCQMMCGSDKTANIAEARRCVEEAVAGGARLVALPECWNSPYDTSSFPTFAEPVPDVGVALDDIDAASSPCSAMLCSEAKRHGIYLIGGSVPECVAQADGKPPLIFNTCIVAGPDGKVIAKHRKVHLFDIDVPGKITFKESDTLTAGDAVTFFDTPFGRVGVGICYDIRFPEQAMMMRQRGCSVLVYPGAFNMTTGPAHWELLQRARAVDTQSFVAAVSPARNPDSGYQAWGHSTVVSPWGVVEATTSHAPATVFADLDLSKVTEFRENVPTALQKRHDMYKLTDLTADR